MNLTYHHVIRPGILLVVLILGFMATPVRADDAAVKAVASAAMQTWLLEIDRDEYVQSWQDAAPSLQKVLTSDQWVKALTSVRKPLGKCTERKLASATEKNEISTADGVFKGDFIIAQYDSTFENSVKAVETVRFEKMPDGTWKVAAYHVKTSS